MKKSILTLLTFIPFLSFGQSQFNLTENGFVGSDTTLKYNVYTYSNAKKETLYKKALIYLSSIYNNPDKVLTKIDGESIIINAIDVSSIKDDKLTWYIYQIDYNIVIQFKDGRVKIEPYIKRLTEDNTIKTVNQIYLKSSDSPKPVEIDAIFIKNEGRKGYFLYKKSIKNSIDNWINSFVFNLDRELKKNDW
ncbi:MULTISPECIES: DUF4468 domain-containing protein [unclassified Pedobacter]|uniref:DUF4468 domain-containing protein n=1 Tax=unclassified Pedobacter TaxID=2628915 RepID=UPI001420916B|nr:MULTISPECIES: DUF4468 domain-containing protein [unclassified Pedobacter]NII81683.1 hypothetical protein [Pedobacter sp. SG908]NMN35687.1 hypothetical protein [Pedobacter sp. SG918]